MSTVFATPAAIRNTTLGILCGMGAGALWGLVFLAPELVRDFTPLQLAIGRYTAYGVISAALIGPRWRALARSLTRRDWLVLAWLSFTGNILYYALLSTAVRKAGITLTSLVIGFLPVAVTIAGSREAGAVPLRVLATSLMLCVGGALCIGWQALVAPTLDADNHYLMGLACAIGALTSWSAYAVTNSRSLASRPDLSVNDWNLLTGIVTGAQALLLVPATVLHEPIRHSLPAWAHLAAISVGVAVAASILGNALWNRMSRLLPLTMTGQMILFETLFALLYGFLWERRLPLPIEVAAGGFVIASVLACIHAHRRQQIDVGATDRAMA